MSSIHRSQRFSSAAGTLDANDRGADPDYSSTLGYVEDLQTTPGRNSTGELTSSQEIAPLWRTYTYAKSLGGTCQAAVYATSLIDGSERAATVPVTVPASGVFQLLDLGAFQLQGWEAAHVRIWGSSGGRIQNVSMVIRPDQRQAVDYIDPAAPGSQVTVTGSLLENTGTQVDPEPSGLTAFISAIPAPAHPELIDNLYYLAYMAGDPDPVTTGFWAAVYDTLLKHNGTNIGLENNFGATSIPTAADATPMWTVAAAANMNIEIAAGTAISSTPGDTFAIYMDGGWQDHPIFPAAHTWYHDEIYVRELLLAKVLQTVDVICEDSQGLRNVTYSHPLPAAIDHWEAWLYTWDPAAAHPTSATLIDAAAAANPYVFPPQPPGRYLMEMRAVYHDGSWAQDGCFHTPAADENTPQGLHLWRRY